MRCRGRTGRPRRRRRRSARRPPARPRRSRRPDPGSAGWSISRPLSMMATVTPAAGAAVEGPGAIDAVESRAARTRPDRSAPVNGSDHAGSDARSSARAPASQAADAAGRSARAPRRPGSRSPVRARGRPSRGAGVSSSTRLQNGARRRRVQAARSRRPPASRRPASSRPSSPTATQRARAAAGSCRAAPCWPRWRSPPGARRRPAAPCRAARTRPRRACRGPGARPRSPRRR